METEIDIVREVSRRLDGAGLDYMLTGSMALNYYAEPRMTRDIDLVLVLPPSRIDEMVGLFQTDFYVSADAVRGAFDGGRMFNFIHLNSVIKVDFILRKPGTFRENEFARRRRIQVAGFETWIVSKEDLVLSKLAWAKDSMSEKQLDDVRSLLASGVDENYMGMWTKELGLDSLMQHCRHE